MHETQRMTGNGNQLCKVRRLTFRDGKSDGIRAIEVHNESGLYLTCIEDQCLNLYDFSYKGINFAFQSKNGLVSSRYFNRESGEFGFYWPAGMLYTCGLTNTGPAVVDNGIYHAEHGRVGMMPAENVAVRMDAEKIEISGTVRDCLLCGHHLVMERRITIPRKGRELRIEDQITNMEPVPTEFMYLYHFNFGYPLLAPGTRLVKGKGRSLNLASADPVPADFGNVSAPQDHKTEELYCHIDTPDADGFGYAGLINDTLGLGGYVKYRMDSLPLLVHWKNMCSHDYCVGLEPSNSYIMGRTRERDNGTLPVLAPYETKKFEVILGVLDGAGEIEAFCDLERRNRE